MDLIEEELRELRRIIEFEGAGAVKEGKSRMSILCLIVKPTDVLLGQRGITIERW